MSLIDNVMLISAVKQSDSLFSLYSFYQYVLDFPFMKFFYFAALFMGF